MMEAIIFKLIKLSNSFVDICCLITLSSDNMGAVGIAVFWAANVMSSWGGGAVPTDCFGDGVGLSQGHLIFWWGADGELEVSFTWQYWTTVVLDPSHVSW